MNKLTLDQIGFIKHKLQEFIALPSTPTKEQGTSDNPDQSQFFRSPNKSKVKQQGRKSTQGAKDLQNDNKKWLAKKQNDILQYITHQNRNRDSILNKFLNSDKIHLKKRQQVDKQFQSKQNQKIKQDKQEQNDESQNFSFDGDGLSSLKKVYKNIGSFLGNKGGSDGINNYQNQSKHQSADNSQLQLMKILNNMQSKPEINQQEKQNKKPTFIIDTQTDLVKPSALKGRFFELKKQQAQTPKISNNTFGDNRKKTFDFDQLNVKDNRDRSKSNKQVLQKKGEVIEKSDSKVQLQKRKKSSSFSNVKPANQQNRDRQKSIPKKDRNFIQNISGSPSKKSFQFFDSQRPSTIRPYSQIKPQKNQNRRQSIQYHSPSKKNVSPKNFPSSVYKKSFKQNPYELTNYQKFYINKYRSKDLSPNQRRNLKQKYELLDQRLVKILQTVKTQKQPALQCYSSPQIQGKQLPSKKTQIPEEILIYQKFSPLKKILKINKQHRMKFNPDDF